MAETRCKPKPSGSRVLIPGRRTAGPLSLAQTPTSTHSPGTGKDLAGSQDEEDENWLWPWISSQTSSLGRHFSSQGLSFHFCKMGNCNSWNGGTLRSWLGNSFVKRAVVTPQQLPCLPCSSLSTGSQRQLHKTQSDLVTPRCRPSNDSISERSSNSAPWPVGGP